MSKLTEVLKLLCYDPETDGNLTFNVTEALTKNWDKIDQLVLLAVAAAAAYDPEGSYAVGDYCTHGGKLHKCGTAIPDGEPWNAEHWTATTVAAELADVRVSLSNKLSIPIAIPGNTDLNDYTTPGMYYCGENGTTVQNKPTDADAFSLFVEKNHAWGTGIKQTFTHFATGQTFKRVCGYDAQNTKGPWKLDATATPPQVRDLTLQSGFEDIGTCTFWKTQENVVTIAGGVAGTLPAGTDTQIGTLIAGYFPPRSYRRNAVTNTGTAYIEIRADGTVWAHPYTAAERCFFDADFVEVGGDA